MTSPPPSHPLDRLSRADRRRWRRLDAGARAVLDAQQLRRVRCLADDRATVDSVRCLEASSPWVSVLAVGVGGWRLVGRVAAWAGALLEAAVASGPVEVVAAGRYGPYWTLGFHGPAAPVTLLVSHLVVSEAHGGAGDDVRWPDMQRAG
jgi:hypothetical protein